LFAALIAGVLVLAAAVGGGVAWWLVSPGAPPPRATAEKSRILPVPEPRPPESAAPAIVPAPVVVPAPPASVVLRAPDVLLRTADEATILADDTPVLSVFAFAQNPAVIVLDFPSLARQGRMLNRVAVLVEKAGSPHDRVLDDAELDATIRGGGDTPENFYLGHDYRASELRRFFALAARDNVALDDDEKWLFGLMKQLGWTADGPPGALISIPRLDGAAGIDETLRQAILHHELAHGEYFTNPGYAAFVQRFWRDTMTREDRAAMTNFLAHDHYDTGIEDLIINESIAYLIHTPDERFFSPAIAKLPARHLAALRADFRREMPQGWLRDDTPLLPVAPAATEPRRAARPRRRYGLVAVSTVSTSKTVAVRRLPCRFPAASIAARKSFK
jgi:hypothetical protein